MQILCAYSTFNYLYECLPENVLLQKAETGHMYTCGMLVFVNFFIVFLLGSLKSNIADFKIAGTVQYGPKFVFNKICIIPNWNLNFPYECNSKVFS